MNKIVEQYANEQNILPVAIDPTIPADDGWGDAATEAAERSIRGTLVRFADWRWTKGKEGIAFAEGTKLVALATAAMWVRWEGSKPAQYIQRVPGRKLPDREELNHRDEAEWEAGQSGERQDPWRNTRLVYLIDPTTAEAFTFSTSSWGGRAAVADLGDQIGRMRSVNASAVPIVELCALEMPTKFGKKSKPRFKVVGWQSSDTDQPKQVNEGPRLISKREADHAMMDDDVPF